MPTLDKDTIIKICAGFAVVVAALVSVILGFWAQIKIKQFELRAQARKDRAAQRQTYYLPLLRLSYELDGRIGRILDQLSSDWLSSAHLEKIRKGEAFAKSPLETGYFIMSSIYVFACFFGWTEAIKRGMDATEPLSEQTGLRCWFAGIWRRIWPRIYFFDADISTVRRLFQYQELFKGYIASKGLTNPKDAYKFHRHFQHSVGDMMLQRERNHFRCKTFREFFEAYKANEEFRYWFVPLEILFVDLSDFQSDMKIEEQAAMKNDIRPLRLLAIRYWCRIMMKNMAKDLGIVTPSPEDVLSGLSEDLKKTIRSVKLEELESYLAGVHHN